MCCKSLKKIVGAVFQIFEKIIAKSGKCTKIYNGSDRMKNPILGIAISKINKTFTASKRRLNTHYGVVSK